MEHTQDELLQFVEQNDVKFIQLAFCDLSGTQKNAEILAEELAGALAAGIPFDASSVAGFQRVEDSDLFLRPDPATLTLLPWRPQRGQVARLQCAILQEDGTSFWGDARALLQRVEEQLRRMGYLCSVGTCCAFYLFCTDERGNPTRQPLDRGAYCDIAPVDRGEDLRREICLTMEELGLRPESAHHECGPGQNEVDFRFADPVRSADQFLAFKSTVKTIAARNGLFASFLPRPLADWGGNGLHLNLSLSWQGQNIFQPDHPRHLQAQQFTAGILDHAREITAFLNSIPNSYARLGRPMAPGYVGWSPKNRSQLIRVPASRGERSRIELRSPDPAVNPYLAYALVLSAGMDGIRRQLELPGPVQQNLYLEEQAAQAGLQPLPRSLGEALELARGSGFVRQVLGQRLLDQYLELKGRETDRPELAEGPEDPYLLFI